MFADNILLVGALLCIAVLALAILAVHDYL
jgi:hypothetical protein